MDRNHRDRTVPMGGTTSSCPTARILVWTSTSGHTYRTEPGSKLLMPSVRVPTGTLNMIRRQHVSAHRGAMMPTRRRTRAADRHFRVMTERNR